MAVAKIFSPARRRRSELLLHLVMGHGIFIMRDQIDPYREQHNMDQGGVVGIARVPVREHGPEPTQLRRRTYVESQHVDVSFEEGPDEVLAPLEAFGVGAREKRRR